jgi:large subunit ribosomal protein L30
MARKPPSRKRRKPVRGVDPVLPPVGKGRGKLEVRQTRSGSGKPPRVRRTLEALGLKRYQDVVVHTDHPALRGMLYQVRHLVRVTPVKG